MKTPLHQALKSLLENPQGIGSVRFASNQHPAPPLAYDVNFPRLELVLSGQQDMEWGDQQGNQQVSRMSAGDVLFVPSHGWNNPRWAMPVTTLSILFGKQQLGFSIVNWDGNAFLSGEKGDEKHAAGKGNVPRRGPRVGALMLQALSELAWHQEDQVTAQFLVKGLLSHTLDLFNSSIQTVSRSQTLFSVIREYLDAHYRQPITRESVASTFSISPNYLSHLFQKSGGIGFNEYLNHVRLEQAKNLLKRYDMKVKEVAHASGFIDSNYFCRQFRKSTERSPSEYRNQYRGQFTHTTG